MGDRSLGAQRFPASGVNPVEQISLRTAAARGVRWTVVLRFSSQAVQWLATLVVVRLLSPSDYGQMAMAMVAISWAMTINDLGIGTAAVRHMLDPGERRSLQGVIFLFSAFLALVLTLTSSLLSWYFSQPLDALIRLISIAIVVNSFSIIQEADLIRTMDFRRQAIIQAITAVLGSGVVLVLATTGFGVWSLAVGYLVTTSIKTLLFAFATRGFYMPSLKMGHGRDKMSFGLLIVLSRLLYALVSSVDIIVIGRMLDTTQLGIFTVGKNFAFIPLSKTGAIVNSISFSVYAKLQHDVRQTHNALAEATNMLALLMFPVSAILSATAPDLQQLLLGDQWNASSIVITLLATTVPFFVIKEQIQHVLTVKGKMIIVIFGQIIEGIVLLIALIVGCQWSLLGACLGWCSAMIVSSVFFVCLARDWTEFSLKSLLVSIQFPLIGSLCAFATIYMLRITISNVIPLPTEIAALGLTGLACYLTMMYLFARSELMRVIDFVRRA